MLQRLGENPRHHSRTDSGSAERKDKGPPPSHQGIFHLLDFPRGSGAGEGGGGNCDFAFLENRGPGSVGIAG